MGRSLWLPLVAVVLTALVQSTKLRAVESDDAVKKEILELQEKQNQAFLQASVNFLDRIYADTIAWTRPTGDSLTKSQFLANLRSGKEKYNAVTPTTIFRSTFMVTRWW